MVYNYLLTMLLCFVKSFINLLTHCEQDFFLYLSSHLDICDFFDYLSIIQVQQEIAMLTLKLDNDVF